MLLCEILQSLAPVYHLTNVRNIIAILQSHTFKLVGGPHTNPEHHYEDPTGQYHMSVARSPYSDFINMMVGQGSIILVLNKNRLQNRHKIKPYQSQDASDEGWTDEMEDRIYSKTPVIPIPTPINQTILQIRLLGGPRAKGGTADFTPEDLLKLQQLCKQLHISLTVWDDEQAFLRGR